MFDFYSSKYRPEKQKNSDLQFIFESVLEEDPMDPEADIDDTIDTDSIPPEVMSKINKEIDRLISDKDYDDSEIDELLDEDDLEEVINEACAYI